MELFYILLVLLVVTRAFGELAERLAQPALVGELVAGIALGAAAAGFPETFPILSELPDNDVFATITDLAMFFLMLYAGVEMQSEKLFQRSSASLAVALGGMIAPLGLGVALGLAFLPDTPLRLTQSLFIGVALAITAVPATVRILTDLGNLESPVGQIIVSAAVFDDILSLILLAWLTAMISGGEAPDLADLAILSGKIALFFLLSAAIGKFIFPWGGRIMSHLKIHELGISAILNGGFAFALLAEALGLHFIVGAFLAGLFFGRGTIDNETYERVSETLSAVTFGFLAPIFFASIGFHADFSVISAVPWFLALLLLSAFVGKIVGAGGAARIFGFTMNESVAIGVGMSPRGAVELVIAGIALDAGLFVSVSENDVIISNLFSAVVMMSVLTTVISPIILKLVFARL
ncbi:cation:proton antiporter [Pseudodonghicola xiamenensis]|uniref:Na+/H+ antiporter GerT n=1 Tax=Pseudodonghicola xiamenensis TaxID=337702 RepID=A0A8J3H8Z8_9RHOB|nr:cation:proton antiporter [Pseudodonghicola xiamenensis]GHG93005.1 Na+/H+ antiporter GerT [Pseudodonghicola xiamenensis]